jgi:PPOX class probable F420-dependent enzyme
MGQSQKFGLAVELWNNKNGMIIMSEASFDEWKDEGTLSLTTYYKSGKGVATPLGYARKGNKIYVNTRIDSYKIKRLQNNPNGKIALSNMRGTLKSSSIDVKVRILNPGEDDDAKEAMKYDSKFTWKLMRFTNKIKFWSKPVERVFLEIEKA